MTSFELDFLIKKYLVNKEVFVCPLHAIVLLITQSDRLDEFLAKQGIQVNLLKKELNKAFFDWLKKAPNKNLSDIQYKKNVSECFRRAFQENTAKNLLTQFLLGHLVDNSGLNTSFKAAHNPILQKHKISLEYLFPFFYEMESRKFPFQNEEAKSEENDEEKIDFVKTLKNMVPDFDDVIDCPVSGRDNDLKELQSSLLKLSKSNVMLLGKAGVGKTALVEGFAWLIAQEKCHPLFFNRPIISINIGELMAGTQLRGDLEEKISDMLKFAENSKCILFIDEIHQIATGRSGQENIMNLLKDKMARGKISVIGATTFEEYQQIEDTAFKRRFQEQNVLEPTEQMTLDILEKLTKKYEEHYNISIPYETLQKTVLFSGRFVNHRNFPDKAIDLLESSCVRAGFENLTECTPQIVQDTLSAKFNIPANLLDNNVQKSLINLETELKTNIFGQDKALQSISETITSSYILKQHKESPLSVMFFAGPSGIGKTETAEVLAKKLGRQIIRLNMNEFQSPQSVSKLGGAEPGFIGYEKGGQLTNAVSQNPYSVILLDEFEKAHPAVQRAFLQIFDKGIFTDNKGQTHSFKNTIIIMSSNAGTDYSQISSVGYKKTETTKVRLSRAKLKSYFLPEFFGRINKIVEFETLSDDALNQLIDNIVNDFNNNLHNDYKYTISLDYNLKQQIKRLSYSPEQGARLLNNTFSDIIETPLSKYLLKNPNGNGLLQIYLDTKGYVQIQNQNTK